jgi:hypothetical protein
VPQIYDAIGRTYAATRQPDPRIAAQIHAALGTAGSVASEFWLLRDYFPDAGRIDRLTAVSVDALVELLGGAVVEPVLVPHDCVDGFGAAYWRRPEAYLNPTVRAGMSFLARLDDGALAPGLDRLATELDSGEWNDKYGELLALDALDVGYCLVIAEL